MITDKLNNYRNKKQKINIIPLIDIIFLMLVFFMLATNFVKNEQVSLSVPKDGFSNENKVERLEI